MDKVGTRTANTKDALVMALMATAMFTVNLSHLMMTPLLPPLGSDFDASIAAVGQLVAATFLAWALTGMFIAPLSDRYGRRSLLLLGLGALALSSWLSAVAWNYPTMLVARFLAGCSLGIIGPNLWATLGDYFPAERRGYAMGWAHAGNGMSSLVGVPGVALIAGLAGWRWTFVIMGAVAATLVLVVISAFPSYRQPISPSWSYLANYRKVLSAPSVLAFLAASAAERAGSRVVFTYLPTFLMLSYSLTLQGVAPILFVVALGAVFSNILGGWLSDRTKKVGLFTVCQYSGGSISLPLFVLSPNLWISSVLGLGYYLFNALSQPPLRWIASQIAPRQRATMTGIHAASLQAGNMIGASIGGVLMGQSSYFALALFSLIASVAAASISRFFVREPADLSESGSSS